MHHNKDTPNDQVLRPERCKQAKKIGPCKAAMPMYYFDRLTGTCAEFTYGGCMGNENRFLTRQECEKTCQGKI